MGQQGGDGRPWVRADLTEGNAGAVRAHKHAIIPARYLGRVSSKNLWYALNKA